MSAAGDAKQAEAPAAPPKAAAPSPRARPRRRVLVVLVVPLLGLAAGLGLAFPHLRAQYHLRAAHAELDAYHNPQAIRHLPAVLRTWPDRPEALLLSARAARRAGAYGEAEHGLEKYRQARGVDEAGARRCSVM